MSSNTSCASPVLPTTQDKMSAGRPERQNETDETAVRQGIGMRAAGCGAPDAVDLLCGASTNTSMSVSVYRPLPEKLPLAQALVKVQRKVI